MTRRTPSHSLLFLSLPLLAVVFPGTARSQQLDGQDAGPYPVDPLALPRPSLRAHRITSPIRLDGHLDEAVWAEADTTHGDFIQVHPSPGYPASERTVIRILYDDDNLYIGATLYESEPDRLISPGLEQDFSTTDSDILGIGLDTYHDGQNGFLFAINPAGAIWDAQTFNDQQDVVVAWEGIVELRTSVGEDRWVAEMVIPFTTLRYNPVQGEQVWGLSFSRRIRHLNEESNWAPTPRQFKLYKFSMAGTLTGLEGLRQGRNLWLKPYALGNRLESAGTTGTATTGDLGLDVKWGLTSRLTLDLTANTDFSQVEVDAEQVNLSRFSLFFPEKRDFFLENDGTFAFQDVSLRNYRTGSSSRNFKLFHSRSIGLSPARTPLPIGGGGRLTGKIGKRIEMGLLNMQTRSDGPDGGPDFFPAENFAVARVKTQLGNGSSVGALFVNRQQTASGHDDFNRSYGVDASFNILGNLVLSGYAARTEESDPAGDSRNASMFQAAWRDPLWDVSILAKHVGDDFNPGLGFVDRIGVRRLFTTVGIHPQPDLGPLVEINPRLDVDFFTNLDGDLETRTLSPAVSFLLRDGSSFTVEVKDRFERLFTPLRLAGGTVAPGTYEWTEASATYRVSGSHMVSGSFSVSHGDFFDGTRTAVGVSARIRPNVHWSLDLRAQRNDLELGGEDLAADLYSVRIRWAGNVRTFLMGFVQYNEATDELITNVRFNLIHAPLSDIFVVFTERRSLADEIAEPVRERGLTLKVTRLMAF